MKKESNSGISFFQRYLTVWVIVCMLIGIMLGHFLPGMKEALNHLEYARISIPVAVLIWIMIYPMMMKVDFKSIKNIRKKFAAVNMAPIQTVWGIGYRWNA